MGETERCQGLKNIKEGEWAAIFWCRVILSTGAKSHVFSSGASYHPVPNHLSFIGPGQWYRPVLILNHLYRIVLRPGTKSSL